MRKWTHFGTVINSRKVSWLTRTQSENQGPQASAPSAFQPPGIHVGPSLVRQPLCLRAVNSISIYMFVYKMHPRLGGGNLARLACCSSASKVILCWWGEGTK